MERPALTLHLFYCLDEYCIHNSEYTPPPIKGRATDFRGGLDGWEHFSGNFFKKGGVFSPFSKQKWTGDQKSRPSFYTGEGGCTNYVIFHRPIFYGKLKNTQYQFNTNPDFVIVSSDIKVTEKAEGTSCSIGSPPVYQSSYVPSSISTKS